MYNPDFWEVCLDPGDLDRYATEAGIWYEDSADGEARIRREKQCRKLMQRVMDLVNSALTERQQQVVILYYLHEKTEEEVAQIMGISRRVVSQHLFGICRNGRHVGGALKKIRKLCHQRGIAAH